tara:strand:- start:575 stop:1150 length:576 start_codon:yes stop_codon:yes gene_type:complete
LVKKRLSSDILGSIEKAATILANNGIIIYPTDTLYGFGCDATNEKAIIKLNKLKNRTSPMSVLAPNKETASGWMDIPENEKTLPLEKLVGSTTIVVPVKEGIVHPSIQGENHSLGIRIPNHPFCDQLSMEFKNPITTTSVNRKGMPPMTDPEKIIEEFENEIDLFLEDGIIEGKGSTVYKYENGALKILRL